jgi:hypothetical protein
MDGRDGEVHPRGSRVAATKTRCTRRANVVPLASAKSVLTQPDPQGPRNQAQRRQPGRPAPAHATALRQRKDHRRGDIEDHQRGQANGRRDHGRRQAPSPERRRREAAFVQRTADVGLDDPRATPQHHEPGDRSTRLATGLIPLPKTRLPFQCPRTARSATSAGSGDVDLWETLTAANHNRQRAEIRWDAG